MRCFLIFYKRNAKDQLNFTKTVVALYNIAVQKSIFMDRGSFLKGIALSGALVMLGNDIQAEPVKKTVLCSPYIAGFKYNNGEEVQDFLGKGQKLELRRESKNGFDRYAVEVLADGVKLGYLPRGDNKMLARMMDQGIDLKAMVYKIAPKEDYYRRVRVEVYF